MNYLAHLFLAEDNPESIIGNFLGDFVKGRLEGYKNIYNLEIIAGIKNHRLIDTFTDNHYIYRQSKRRISKDNSRYSGIIIDICYDHFLATKWSNFSEINLEKFTEEIYKVLKTNYEILPTRLKNILPIIIRENWLLSYKTIDGINITFKRLSRRLKRENQMERATEELIRNYEELEADFLLFFPEVIQEFVV